jgi:hypothetical protein
MACLVPLTVLTEEVIVRALHLRAAKEGVRPAEAANALLRAALAAEIEEAAAGLPPLAEVIQGHLDREQQAMKGRSVRREAPGQQG